jgi:hypothetical protein
MYSITNIALDTWNELVVASSVEPPLKIKSFFDELVKVEDPNNAKVMVTLRDQQR